MIDETKILTATEIRRVLEAGHAAARRGTESWCTLMVFRLAACCGLRATEICLLDMKDVRCHLDKPYLNLRKVTTKRHKPRRVPLWWDRNTLDDMRLWKAFREQTQSATGDDPFICAQNSLRVGKRLVRQHVRSRFMTCCRRALGAERAAELTVHHGRHTFASHMLASGRTLPEVQAALGHANSAMTAIYLHVAVEDNGEPRDVFGGPGAEPKYHLPMMRLGKVLNDH